MSYIDEYEYDGDSQFIKMIFGFALAGLIICGMYGCIRDSHRQYIEIKAIEAGLHQDQNGHWTK